MRRLIRALAAWLCPDCGWWAENGHTCHPADR